MGRLEVRVCGARRIGDTQKVGIPDPYVKVRLGDDKKSMIKYKTRVINNNLNPVWDEAFKFMVSDYDAQQIVFEVWNDNVLVDDLLGSYALSLNGVVRGALQDTWVVLSGTKLSSAELHLRFLAVDFGRDPLQGEPTFSSLEDGEAAVGAAVYAPAGKLAGASGPSTVACATSSGATCAGSSVAAVCTGPSAAFTEPQKPYAAAQATGPVQGVPLSPYPTQPPLYYAPPAQRAAPYTQAAAPPLGPQPVYYQPPPPPQAYYYQPVPTQPVVGPQVVYYTQPAAAAPASAGQGPYAQQFGAPRLR